MQNGDAISSAVASSDPAFYVALALATFAILFGTRHIDATEHQSGLMLAIAAESFIKLLAFLAVGIFVTWFVFDGIGDLVGRADAANLLGTFEHTPRADTWITLTLLAFCAAFLLPRQFHVTVVENHSESEVKRASWLFPIYLVLINLFVIPIALVVTPYGVRIAHALSKRHLEIAFGLFLLFVGARFLYSIYG